MRLSFPPGPLPTLYAAGVPDWVGADGTHVGWTLRDKLFLLDGDGARVVPLPDWADDVATGPGGWTIATETGFVRVDPAKGQVVSAVFEDEREPVACRPGEEVGLFVEVPEHRLIRLSDGLALPLPDAALRARWIHPWETGVGACWVDMDTLYRMGSRISALGKAPGSEGIRCGPGGAVVVALKKDTVVAAARGLAVQVGRRLDPDSARFAADGQQVLAATEQGVVLVDLRDGRVVREWEGSFAPVGFALAGTRTASDGAGPVLWDLDRAALVDGEGAVLVTGLAASVPGVAGNVLAGPGGAVWDLSSGERTRDDVREGACATDGRAVVHVTGDTVRVLGGATFAHGLLTGDEDEVERARIDGDAVVIETLDGEAGAFALADGAVRWRKAVRAPTKAKSAFPEGIALVPEEEEGAVEIDGKRWSLPADGAARAGGRVWLWTDEGFLAAVPDTTASGIPAR